MLLGIIMYLMNYTNLLQCWTLYSYSMQVDLNKNNNTYGGWIGRDKQWDEETPMESTR